MGTLQMKVFFYRNCNSASTFRGLLILLGKTAEAHNIEITHKGLDADIVVVYPYGPFVDQSVIHWTEFLNKIRKPSDQEWNKEISSKIGLMLSSKDKNTVDLGWSLLGSFNMEQYGQEIADFVCTGRWNI